MRNKTKLLEYLYIGFSLVIGILFAILFSTAYPAVDDLIFMWPSKGMERGIGLWNIMMDYFQEIYQTQSGRLGNYLAMPFLYLFPRWIYGILGGGLVAFLLIFSCKIVRVKPGSFVGWLLMATIVFAYPWYDYLLMITYNLNYLWSAAAVVGAIWCFLKIRRFRRWGAVASLFLMFVAGWMHEGFGAPFTAGLTLYLLCNFRNVCRREILCWIAAAAGTCMVMMSPMFWQRSDEVLFLLLKFSYKEGIMQLGPALLFFLSFFISSVILLSGKNTRKLLLASQVFPILAGFSLSSLVVFIMYYCGPRTGSPLLLSGALGCGVTFSIIGRNRSSAAACWLAAILIGGLSVVNLVSAISLQSKLNAEEDRVIGLFEASEDGTIYFDLRYPTLDLSLFKTNVRQFHEKTPKWFFQTYYGAGKTLVVLPSEMKGFRPSKATESHSTPGAMIYNGWIVLPESTDVSTFKRIKIELENGDKLPGRFRRDYFKAEDGKTYILIAPHEKTLNPGLRIKDVILHDHSR